MVRSQFKLIYLAKVFTLVAGIAIAFSYISLISVYKYGLFHQMSLIWYVSLVALFFFVGLVFNLLAKVEISKTKIIFSRILIKPETIEIKDITRMHTFYSRRSAISNDTGTSIRDANETLRIHVRNDFYDISGNEYANYNEVKNEIKKNRKL